MKSKRKSHSAGFTLLEVLIATAVLGTALVSLIALNGRDIELVAETKDLTIAGLLAKKMIALSQVGPFPTEGKSEGVFATERGLRPSEDTIYGGSESEDFVWTREVRTVMSIRDLRHVLVTVSRTKDRPLVQLETLVWRNPS